MRTILFLLLLFIVGCNKGIEPGMQTTETGISGKITFVGEWPEGITSTNLVLFKDPILSETNFNIFNIKYAGEVIPNGVSFYQYNTSSGTNLLNTIEPGEHSYLAVIQTTKDTIELVRSAWFVSGVYYNSGNTSVPGKLNIAEGETLFNIDIICDFNNPPPQPPGGEK